MSYIVITRNEDGEVRVEELTKDRLERELEKQVWGPIRWLNDLRGKNRDPQYWDGGSVGVIIRGDVVKPSPVDVVKRWSVE